MYKIIFLDYSMPDFNGKIAASCNRDLFQDNRLVEKPYIYCCTAYEDAVFKERALDAGMDNYLNKPISKNELASKYIK